MFGPWSGFDKITLAAITSMNDTQIDVEQDLRNALEIDVHRCKGGANEPVPDEVFMGSWTLQLKLDGIRLTVQLGKTKNHLVSRNRHNKLKGVAAAGGFVTYEVDPFSKLIHPDLAGTMLDGELMLPGQPAAKVLSLETRAHPERLRYVVFDCLFYEGIDVRQKSYGERLQMARMAMQKVNHPQIEMVKSWQATRENLKKLWESGEEGGVFAKMTAKYGESCTRDKAKSRVDIDGFIIAVTEGRHKGSPKAGIKPVPNGKAALFQIGMYDQAGKIYEVGYCAALPDEVQDDGLKDFASKYKDKVIRMTASGWDGAQFRWIRWAGFHEDKSSPEQCKLDEQVGNLKIDGMEVEE